MTKAERAQDPDRDDRQGHDRLRGRRWAPRAEPGEQDRPSCHGAATEGPRWRIDGARSGGQRRVKRPAFASDRAQTQARAWACQPIAPSPLPRALMRPRLCPPRPAARGEAATGRRGSRSMAVRHGATPRARNGLAPATRTAGALQGSKSPMDCRLHATANPASSSTGEHRTATRGGPPQKSPAVILAGGQRPQRQCAH